MQKIDIILVLNIAVLALSVYIAYRTYTSKAEGYVTCPDPASYAYQLKLSGDETKTLFRKCLDNKALPTFDTDMTQEQIDDQISKCLVGCYPDMTLTRDGKNLQICRIPCQKRSSPECLKCVQDKYCQISNGGMSIVPCDLSQEMGRGMAIVDKDTEAAKKMEEIAKRRAAQEAKTTDQKK